MNYYFFEFLTGLIEFFAERANINQVETRFKTRTLNIGELVIFGANQETKSIWTTLNNSNGRILGQNIDMLL